MKSFKSSRGWALFASLGLLSAAAFAGCPTKFKLSGKIDQPWSQVTNNQWNNMLPKGWVDKGFHFYSRIRERGPADGINTPSDLESEIMKRVADQSAGSPNRWEYVLPIKNSSGASLKVIYDYDGKSTSNCELVTLSY